MSWIATTDLHSPLFNIRGIGVAPDAPGARPPLQPDEILATGTMVMELRFNIDSGAEQTLIAYRRHSEWLREVTVTLDSSGKLVLDIQQGRNQSRAEIGFPPPARDSRMRVSYAWNAPARSGFLTVELLDEGRMFQAEAFAPVPLPADDVRTMIRNGRHTRLAPFLTYLAFSNTVEPVGLGGGLVSGTKIETPDGPRGVEKLRLGELVTTATAGDLPVRWIGKRTVPSLGAFRPVKLRAPYFGLEDDVIAAPDQRMRLDIADVEYQFGTEEILLPAGHLADGKRAQYLGRPRLVTYYQILLDVHDCLLHEGIWSESLFVGTLARHPALAKSTVLRGMPETAIPLHRDFANRRLNEYEARSIAAALQHA
ncbi:MAG TPA: hypothetical protein ENK63_02325 [Rhodobacterales bacterium]|nr:hypothetical protein [Rhodobacterales bacterium]